MNQTTSSSEFNQPRWSVMTFADCAASNLRYEEARNLLEHLRETTSGLCIVTDAAARKISRAKSTDQDDLPAPQTFAEIL